MDDFLIIILIFQVISFVAGFYLGIFYGAYLMLKDQGLLPSQSPYLFKDTGGRRSRIFRFIPRENTTAASSTHSSTRSSKRGP